MGVKGVTFYNFGSLDFFPGGCYGGTPPKKLNLKSTKSCLLPWFAESSILIGPTWKDQQIDNVV